MPQSKDTKQGQHTKAIANSRNGNRPANRASDLEKSPEKSRKGKNRHVPVRKIDERAAPCIRCHAHSSVFYCDVCLSERVVSHHVNVRRVDEMRREAQCHVERYLDHDGKALQRHGTVENAGKIEMERRLRAKKARLEQSISEARSISQHLRSITERRRRDLRRRQEEFDSRSELLRRAREKLPRAVTIHPLRNEVLRLRSSGQDVTARLAETRAVLSREVFSLFNVTAPAGTMAEARQSTRASRPYRDKERYVPGAFLHSRQASKSSPVQDIVQINPNDWTILNLVLPLPSDVKRFERGTVNGAIAHTVHLLHLLAHYLGVALPFVMSVPQGIPLIRPNALWGSGTKQSLYLSSSTYAVFPSPPSKEPRQSSTIGNMGASMISSLGASTMSTLESFVHLPGGANLPWAKNAPAVPVTNTSKAGQEQTPGADVTVEKRSNAVKQFYTACTMLAYDIAYMASIQGVKVDLIAAAGSPLRLLQKAVSSPLLGKKAHTTSTASAHLPNLLYPQLEFAQLAQIYEPGASPANTMRQDSDLESRSRRVGRKTVTPSSTSTKKPLPDPMLEGSYIDARKAAESVLIASRKTVESTVGEPKGTLAKQDVNDPTRNASALKREAVSTKSSSNAASTSQRPGTLDFLRTTSPQALDVNANRHTPITAARTEAKMVSRGNAAPKTPTASTDQSSPQVPVTTSRSTSGTVMFNGKEVHATAVSDKPRRSSSSGQKKRGSSRSEEEEWALL